MLNFMNNSIKEVGRRYYVILVLVLYALMRITWTHREIYGGTMISVQEVSEKKERSSTLWTPQVAVFPLSFSLPEGRFGRWKTLQRKQDFAHIIPGNTNTYIYKTEKEYYNGYAEAWFGITMKKSGWDCFRHYEIIAAGSMPYFLDHSSVPKNVLHNFPMSIIRQSMELPGVPTQNEVIAQMNNGSTESLKINRNIFNETEYYRLLDELTVYAVENLTWERTAQYLLDQIHNLYPCMEDPRILMITTQDCDYQSCVLFGGFYSLLGAEKMSSYFGPKRDLFQQFQKKNMYGNGFSYSNVFDNEWNVEEMDKLTKRRLNDGFFNMIVFTNSGNSWCSLDQYFSNQLSEQRLLFEYRETYNPLVVTVDGSDIDGCHEFSFGSDKSFTYHAQFVREYHSKNISDLTEWTGCQAEDRR